MCIFNKVLAAIALLVGANFEVLRAQSQNARLVGRVVDITAAAVPGATVSATHTATGVSRTAFTGETGDYVIENLIPGMYTVKVQLTGFKTQEQQGIRRQSHHLWQFLAFPGHERWHHQLRFRADEAFHAAGGALSRVPLRVFQRVQ